MNESNRWLRRARHWPEQMGNLAAELGELAIRVRESVSELVGTSVGSAVGDLLKQSWQRQLNVLTGSDFESSSHRSDDWQRPDEVDPWAESERDHGWSSRPSTVDSEVPSHALPVQGTALVALAIQAAGWWLRQRGSWFTALGLGCIVGGLAFLGGPIAVAGLNLLEAAGDIYSLNHLLANSPEALSRT